MRGREEVYEGLGLLTATGNYLCYLNEESG